MYKEPFSGMQANKAVQRGRRWGGGVHRGHFGAAALDVDGGCSAGGNGALRRVLGFGLGRIESTCGVMAKN